LLRGEIRKGLDAAAFVYQGFFDMDMVIDIVERAGIPFLMYNMDDLQKRGLGYIGPDNFKGGRLAANFIGKVLESRQKPNVLIIDLKSDFFPHPNSQRVEGFLSIMKEQYPFIHYSHDYIKTESDDPRVEQQLKRILGTGEKKPDAIYFLPTCHTQFQRFLEKNDYRHSIILQHDIDDVSVTSLENRLITAVVYQDPILQGYTVVRTLEKALESKESLPRKEIEISHTLIFKENIGFSQNHFLLLEPNEPIMQN
jgi:LacI family transcriptional regulator